MKFYFGFGANRDREMIKAITGHYPIFGFTGEIKNFCLCYQNMEQIPKLAQKNLKNFWDKNFRSYAIYPAKNNSVSGMVWLITNWQRKKISDWELDGLWSNKIKTRARIIIFNKMLELPVETEIIQHQKHITLKQKRYQTFIVPRKKILQVARQTRNIPIIV